MMKMEVDFEGEGDWRDDWREGYETGQLAMLRQMLRYVVAKMAADAEEELELLKTEREQEQMETGWI